MKKVFSKIFKPSFYFSSKDSKGLLVKDSIKLLKNLHNMADNAPDALSNSKDKKRSKKRDIHSYLKGINDKCLQFEILYEIEAEEIDFPNFDKTSNIADECIKNMNENIHYNIISNQATTLDPYSEPGIVKVTVDSEVRKFNVSAVKMNDNEKYYKAVTDFITSVKHIDSISEFKVYNEKYDVEFNFLTSELDHIDFLGKEKTKTVIEKEYKMLNCIVFPVGPMLEVDMRRNWTIKFTPKLPENMVLDGKSEFSATIKDKKYYKGDFLDDSFKVGDILYCNLKYIVYFENGSFLCNIKKVEVTDVLDHKHK